MARGIDYGRQITVHIEQHLSPQKSALAFARIVREKLDGLVSSGRIPPKYKRFVDGREGAAFESVKPGGTIAAVFGGSYNKEILAFALAFLQARAPRGTGGGNYPTPFRESFWVAISGKFIRPGALNFDHVPDEPVELIVGNLAPFNRKATVQFVGLKPLNFSVPPGMYADCAKAINARFGNIVIAKSVYSIDHPGQWRLRHRQMRREKGRTHAVKRHAGTLVESPALIINPR